IWVFNTHLDHVGKKARLESVKLIRDKMHELNPENYPAVLMGDFNATPGDDPIQYLRVQLKDAREISQSPPYGPQGTFNGFQWSSADSSRNRIDYIFVSTQRVEVLKYGVLNDGLNGRYPSDHWPVFAIINTRKD
ncbi:MAG: endonuclease/exonuclease/phosphatase, partial [Bacteroidia bacterium]|nr:endonuclease/exonuclease/phosphatase [Bacteroidia bacterium]